MRQFRFIKVKDSDLDAVQANIIRVLTPVLKTPIIDGTQVQISLVSGSNRIAHNLGRVPLGYIIVDTTSTETFYRTAWDSATITVTATGTANFSLWVY
jgi:hypothetical protein